MEYSRCVFSDLSSLKILRFKGWLADLGSDWNGSTPRSNDRS